MSAAELSVAVGIEFEVELAAPATAGYVWSLRSPPTGLLLVANHFKHAATAAPGDSSRQVFQLRATQAGRFELQFELKRPWEPVANEARQIVIDAR
jgi:predicted secreted protein